MLTSQEIKSLNERCQGLEPWEILSVAADCLPNLAIAFSGSEDVCLLAMAARLPRALPAFTLDTGRLHPETYGFIERARKHFNIDLEILSPDTAQLERFVAEKGLFSFYQDGHQQCCGIRKLAPLQRKLAGLDGWVTGQRRDQGRTRAAVPVFEFDAAFSNQQSALVKVNPLANWNLQKVWEYIRLMELPYNPLHDQGYVSIGCAPCTRALRPGQQEREARWWWEEEQAKECGLHSSNLGKN